MWAILQQANFRRFWLSQVFLALGDGLMQMGILKVILDHHYNEEAEVAKMSFAVALPGLLVGPLAMSYLGRWQRRSVLMWSDGLRAGLVVMIAWWVFPLLTGRVEQRDLLNVYWLIGVIGVIATFYLPARTAIIPNLISADDLVKANTLFAISQAIAAVGGRVLGGAVAEKFGVMCVVLANVVTCVASVGLLGLIRMAPHAVSTPVGAAAKGGWHDFQEAVIYLREHPTALPLFIVSGVFAFVLGILVVVFIGYANKTLHLGASGIGYLFGAGGAGAAIGMVVLGMGKPWTKSDWLPVGQLILAAATLVLLNVITSVWLALPVIFVLGGVCATVMIAIDSRLQSQVEDRHRGAVFAARGALTSLTMCIAFGLQIWSSILRDTPAPIVMKWLGIGAAAGAGLMLVLLMRRKKANRVCSRWPDGGTGCAG